VDRDALRAVFPADEGWNACGYVVLAPASPETLSFELVVREIRGVPTEVVRAAIEEPLPPYGIVLAFRITSLDGTDSLTRGEIAVAIVKERSLKVLARTPPTGQGLPSIRAVRGAWFDHHAWRGRGFPLSNDRREELVDEMSWNGGGSVAIASIRDCQARGSAYDIEVSPIPDEATVERTIGPVSVWPEPYWQLSIRLSDDE
jgi:hypothetical protein